MTTQTKDEVAALLADYLTGDAVTYNSMMLKVAVRGAVGAGYDNAEKFFAIRKAFGVEGYPTKEEALKTIKSRL